MAFKRGVIFLLMMLAVLLAGTSLAQETAQLRFIHAWLNSPPIDVYVNDRLAAANLMPGDASPYLDVTAGGLDVSSTIAFTNILAFPLQRLNADAGGTVSIAMTAAGEWQAIADNTAPLAFGEARLAVYYGLGGGPAVDVISKTDGMVIGENGSPGTLFGTFDLPAGLYELALVPSGSDVSASIVDLSAALTAGTSSIVLVHGAADDPQILTAAAAVQAEGESGKVRFVNAMPGAAVDLSLNGALFAPALNYATPSAAVPLPAGAYSLTVSLGGIEIAAGTLDVAAGQIQTAAIMGSLESLSVAVFGDSLSDVAATSALARMLNAIPDSVVERLAAGGTSIAADVGYGEASGAVSLPGGRQSLEMNMADGGTASIPNVFLFDGTHYHIIALPDAELLLIGAPAAYSLTGETPMSSDASESEEPVEAAPADDDADVEEATVTEDAASEIAVEAAPADDDADVEETAVTEEAASEEAVEAAPADDDADVEETAVTEEAASEIAVETAPADDDADVEEATVTEEAASEEADDEAAAPAAIFVGEAAPTTARVINLDAGANLHLRRYPSRHAMSLGLVSAGADLMVRGRGDSETAGAWLYVDYMTPDGGLITAWVNSLYVQISDESGAPQALDSLETVRRDLEGTSRGTSITPPQPTRRVVGRIQNLDPGVHLNIRVANHINSQVLGTARGGATVTFMGLDENDAWAWIEHQSAENVSITGWVSTTYLNLLLDGDLIEIDAIKARDASLVPQISGERRGFISTGAGGEAPPLPTQDPLLGVVVGEVQLNPGASLHLRFQPNVNARSLALIPAGTQLVVNGITESGEWLRVMFESDAGWVWRQYLDLSFNERYISSDELAERLTMYDNDGN